jgi:FecR protein
MNDEESVERRIREAGARPALPEEDLAAIREAGRAEWRGRYARRPAPNRGGWWMAIAAAVALAAVALVWRARTAERAPAGASGAAPVVATVERASEGGRWTVGSAIAAGSPVETADDGRGKERVALRMAGGASLRLDGGTRARLASPTLVELERGAVYVDDRGGAGVEVRAPAGLFQPAGTQFEVRVVESGATRLKVREGSVALDLGGESLRAASGEELTVRRDGSVARRSIPTFGPEWEWVLDTAAPPDIEGMKVRRFLEWVTREAGWRLDLGDAQAAALADSVELHGSIAHLTPVDAIGVVLSSAGLEHRLSNGTLVVSVSKKGRP